MAQSRSNIDVALVMDSSGSMIKTDPKSLRIPAAKLFISLLDSNDRAAVLSFSDKGYPIADLTPVNNEANKNKLLNATEEITSKGLHTNLYGAFNKGMEVLLEAKEDGREQIIVLMSDGMMDVGDPEKDRQLLAKLKSELSGVLKKNNIKVYAIAFTDQSDRRLLEKLSKQTGGFYNLAFTDKDFHLIFTSIFESLKSPEMLPMEKNGFLIDGSIQEVTIVVSKESAATGIQINAPDGQQYSGDQKYSGISWFVSDNFDMITVQKPVEGRWEILYSTGENNKAYIITDLKLETNFEQLYAVFGENLNIKAWLEKEGSIIRYGEVLETTDLYIELNNPDGNISNLNPLNSGDGIFQKSITPFKDGNYRLRVIAKGKTYEREKAFLFNVANLQESKEDLKAAREAMKTEQAEVQEHPAEEEQEPVNWAKIIIQFISINLIIGILVVAYMKRQSIKDFKLIGKVFKRSKDTKPSQVKKQEPEESPSEAESVKEESAEKETGETAQVRKDQVALEDADSESKEAEQGNEAEDREPVKERVALEEAASEEDVAAEKGNDGAINNIEEEIQKLEKLKQQEGETQATEAREDTASETEEPQILDEGEEGQATKSVEEKVASTDKEQTTDEQAMQAEVKAPSESDKEEKQAVDAGAEEIAQAEDKDGEDDDVVDDMWAAALNEQTAAESGDEKVASAEEEKKAGGQAPQPEEAKESPVPQSEAQAAVETEEEETVQAEEKSGEDSVDDMWADALNEQTAAESGDEKVASAEEENKTDGQSSQPEEVKESPVPQSEAQAAVESDEKETVQAEENGGEDSVDDMWAEALSDHAEASEEKPSDNKENPGGSPGASS